MNFWFTRPEDGRLRLVKIVSPYPLLDDRASYLEFHIRDCVTGEDFAIHVELDFQTTARHPSLLALSWDI